MEFRGQIFNTIEEWNTVEALAHQTCLNEPGYTSDRYAEKPIMTTDNKFILLELKGFEDILKEAGLDFQTLNSSIIKEPEIN